MESTTNLKLVKRASIHNEAGVFVIQHYGTKIFEYNPENKEAWAYLNCSLTSNKQIKYAIDFFSLDAEKVKIKYSPKWAFSGVRT